jgi:hypothetical protein
MPTTERSRRESAASSCGSVFFGDAGETLLPSVERRFKPAGDLVEGTDAPEGHCVVPAAVVVDRDSEAAPPYVSRQAGHKEADADLRENGVPVSGGG